MSYAHFEHYQWIERACNVKCSNLGIKVANILGYVGNGIYNAPINYRKINWEDDYYIGVNWNSPMSNWDFPELTKLVIECHRQMIRVSIAPNMRSIKITFHQRKTRDKNAGTMKRLPDIEEMIEMRDKDFSINNWQPLPPLPEQEG